jgi:hypothetical protein
MTWHQKETQKEGVGSKNNNNPFEHDIDGIKTKEALKERKTRSTSLRDFSIHLTPNGYEFNQPLVWYFERLGTIIYF